MKKKFMICTLLALLMVTGYLGRSLEHNFCKECELVPSEETTPF